MSTADEKYHDTFSTRGQGCSVPQEQDPGTLRSCGSTETHDSISAFPQRNRNVVVHTAAEEPVKGMYIDSYHIRHSCTYSLSCQ